MKMSHLSINMEGNILIYCYDCIEGGKTELK